ncbi:transmembrane sensor [Aquamicrobium lusatiense]|uniref:Transmembrane sensor n=1 Tax=Aquamicrobium lusatiense TaxID=89772 RepID=A0A7W9VWK1_9HYPH|nr:FecR domain-containing protein [Aquamicrobium lusatiense]MBB6014193.1 transmembrane sensor [Aquamicrobium lusatiense]
MDEADKNADDDRGAALDARDWIVRLTSGNVSDAELTRFKAWRERSPQHRLAFERERAFWQQLQGLEEPRGDVLPFRPPRRTAISRRAVLAGGGAAAAAGLAIVALPRMELWWNADFTTGVGDRAEVNLPDGSIAVLNTDSAIAVDFSPQMRLVKLLRGEAEFQVRRDEGSLFRVAALGGNSDALGTTFTVSALDGMATVTVSEGRVLVSGPAAAQDRAEAAPRRVELGASEQTAYAEGGAPQPVVAVDTETVLAWRSGRVIFEGRPFASAVAELARYMPERIVMRPGVDGNVPVSAIFSTSEAFAAMQALARTQGLTVRRIPRVMVLIS